MSKFDPRKYWQNRGTRYPVTTARVETEMASLSAWIGKRQPQSVLDVGSGWGRVYNYLTAQEITASYTMVDFVDSMRQGCQGATGVLPDKWDGVTLPYADRAFGLVLSVDVLLHVPPADIGRVFAEHARVSRRWLYVITNGTVYKPLADHCFWHDYLRLFSEAKLYIAGARFWRRGMRVHWILERFG